MQTITVTEEVYRHLSERAARLQLTPEQLIEQLLVTPSEEEDLDVPPAGSGEALAAVSRLSGLFGDLALPDLDAALADPLLALANVDLDDLGR
ncbi:MAG: hypothetical protein HGA65_01660 [Oscillochloris sp.]|nr:hypothetical protein [Oscillochloris sp.]